jgi:hypothetical protein
MADRNIRVERAGLPVESTVNRPSEEEIAEPVVSERDKMLENIEYIPLEKDDTVDNIEAAPAEQPPAQAAAPEPLLSPTAPPTDKPTIDETGKPEPTPEEIFGKGIDIDPESGLPSGFFASPLDIEDPNIGDEDQITIAFEDVKNDEWKYAKVEAGKVRNVVSGRDMFDRAVEGQDRNGLVTDMYDQNNAYYWGPKTEDHPATAKARALGYRPVRKSDSHFHRVIDTPGLGKTVALGDLRLYACPRIMQETRENERLDQRDKDKREWKGDAINNIMSHVDEDGRRVRIEHMDFGQSVRTVAGDQDFDRNEDIVNSVIAAQERAYGKGGRQSFGGFNGAMGRGIPESPFMRNRGLTSQPTVYDPNRRR